MLVRVRVHVLGLLSAAALAMLGCDTGGLLVVEGTGSSGGPVTAPQSNDFVTAGTKASNGKFKVVYTIGQPSPHGVQKNDDQRMNGGLVGAVHGP